MSRHPSRLAAATSGVLAALAGMSGAHLVAGVVAPAASPVLAVGSVVIDLTPTPVKEFAVAQFGTADKPILLGSILLVTLLAAAAIGVLAARRPRAGSVALTAVVALAGVAVALRPGSSVLDLVPTLVAAVIGLLVLHGLLRLAAGRAASVSTSTSTHPSRDADMLATGTAYPTGGEGRPRRRAFVFGALGTGAGALAMGGAGQLIAAAPTATTAVPPPTLPLPALATGLESTVAGISAFQTPQSQFYRVDINLSVPRVDAARWRLHIDGDVDTPRSYSYADLLAMELVERDITMTCVSNEVGGQYVGAARWLGVPVRRLLEASGVRSGADQILSTAVDGFTISTPVQALLDDRDALLAIGMNGETLSPEHGYPVRLVTPGLYGFVGSTKWLTRLTATTYAEQRAYWTQRDWATDAPIKTMARIDTPKALTNLPAGTLAIGGVAWAQQRGIQGVQVQVDDGPWRDATLGPDAGVDYWRQWYLPWKATPGRHSLTVRATDGTGSEQLAARAKPFPNGASGWQQIVVFVT